MKACLLAIGLAALVLGIGSVRRYRAYEAGVYDMAIAEQTAWNTSRGRLLVESVNMGEPRSRFWNGRWELVWLPLALPYRLWPRVEALLVIQAVAVALGGVAVYRLGKGLFGGGGLVGALVVAYLLQPALHNAVLFDLHAVTFAIPLLMGAFVALLRGSRRGALGLAVAALLCREDVALPVAALGLYALVARRERRLGAALVAIAALWLAAARSTGLLREALGLAPLLDPNQYPSRWAHLGGESPQALLATALERPADLVRPLLTGENARYLVKLLLPLAFLPTLSGASLMAIPSALVNMWSRWPMAHNIEHHYAATVLPALVVGAALGLRNLHGWMARHPTLPLARPLTRSPVLAVILLAGAGISATAWSRVGTAWRARPTEHHRMLDEALARLPEGASVSAHFFLGDHLARRERLFLFPDHREDADLLVYDLALPFTRLMTRRTVQHRAELPINAPFLEALRDPRYGVTLYRDGLVLLRKGADHEAGLGLLLEAPSWEIDQRALRPVGAGLWCAGSTYRGRAGLSRGWAHLTLYWTAPEGLGKEMELLLRCEGPAGETQIRHVPLLGLLPARRWTPGRIFRDEVFIPLPPGPPRGTYWVRGALTGGTASAGGDVALASFEVR